LISPSAWIAGGAWPAEVLAKVLDPPFERDGRLPSPEYGLQEKQLRPKIKPTVRRLRLRRARRPPRLWHSVMSQYSPWR